MGIFDTIVKAAGDYLGSDDGDEMIDNFRGFFSGDDGGGSDDDGGGGGGFGQAISSFLGGSDDGGDGSGGWGSALGSFLGGSEDGGDGDGEGGGWGRTFGNIVDRLSGDGGREGLWDRAVDTISPYLPEEVRNVAGQFLGQGGQGGQAGQGSSWAGSLVDTNQTHVPNGWHAVGNHPTVGHSFGESGFGGFVDHSINNLMGNYAAQPGYVISPQMGNGAGPGTAAADVMPGRNGDLPIDDGIRYIRAPDVEPGQPLGHDGSPDPRVSMPADALGRTRYVDTDGDGVPDVVVAPGPLPRSVDGNDYGADVDGGFGDAYPDADGDGYPDGPPPAPPAGGDRPGYDDRADYDDLVTSGAPASQPGYDVPDDPTFPADPAPAPAPVAVDQLDVEAPASDFDQSIDDADQVDQSMGDRFEGVE